MNQNAIETELLFHKTGYRHLVHVEFDGGTPCNIPRKGYGIGYGSWKLATSAVHRCNFGRPMSANVAEMSTAIAAIRYVIKAYNPAETKLVLAGDSRIALNRCLIPVSKPQDNDFCNTADQLYKLCQQFAKVETKWRGRQASVALFGH